MSVSLSVRARNGSGAAVTNLLDIGSANLNGYAEIRTGVKPSNPLLSAPGILLATLPLSNPAFGIWANGQSIANQITPDTAVAATGRAGWFRFYDRDNVGVVDGTITSVGGSGDIQFDEIDFIEGGTVAILTLSATVGVSG